MSRARPVLVLAALLLAAAAAAEPRSPGTLTLVVENDAVFSDRNYSSGLLLSYVSGDRPEGAPVRWLGRHLFCADEKDRVRFGLAVGQSLFTPERISAKLPPPDQHPYAGWLYGAISMLVESEDTLDTLALELGVVGPKARGEEAQNFAHDVLGSVESKGWDEQVRNEFAVALYYDRKWRLFSNLEWKGIELDLTPNVGLAAGNRLSQASVGLTLRIGDDLGNDFGPLRVRPGLSGSGLLHTRDRLSGYVFVGAQGRAVAYDITLDGNTNGRGPSVDRRPLTGDMQAGVALQLYRLQGGISVMMRSSEFRPQGKADIFSSLFLSIHL